MAPRHPARAILRAGTLCGALDIGFVIVYYGSKGVGPVRAYFFPRRAP